MAIEQLALFDYAALDADTRSLVQQRTDELRGLLRRAAQDIVIIGLKLTEVKAALGHGRFLGWLAAEFEWSERTARRFMAVADQFKTANLADLAIAPAALYVLSADSTPEPARQEAIERAEAGESITYTAAREIVEQHRPEATEAEPIPHVQTIVNGYKAPTFTPPADEVPEADDWWDDEPEEPAAPAMPISPPPAPFVAPSRLTVDDGPAPDGDSDEWYTPAAYIELARQLLGGIDLDPASNPAAQALVQAGTYYTKAENGLVQPWQGRVWLNPPFSTPRLWVERLIESHESGSVEAALLLVNSSTETSWFQQLLRRYRACFPKKRIGFWRVGQSETPGNRYAQTLFYLGPRVTEFAALCADIGCVVEPATEGCQP